MNKRKQDPPCKACPVCFMVVATATKQCYECGHLFYIERKKRNAVTGTPEH